MLTNIPLRLRQQTLFKIKAIICQIQFFYCAVKLYREQCSFYVMLFSSGACHTNQNYIREVFFFPDNFLALSTLRRFLPSPVPDLYAYSIPAQDSWCWYESMHNPKPINSIVEINHVEDNYFNKLLSIVTLLMSHKWLEFFYPSRSEHLT